MNTDEQTTRHAIDALRLYGRQLVTSATTHGELRATEATVRELAIQIYELTQVADGTWRGPHVRP
jgi:hypothetical protein